LDFFDLEPNNSFATRHFQPDSSNSGNDDLEGLFFLKPNVSGITF